MIRRHGAIVNEQSPPRRELGGLVARNGGTMSAIIQLSVLAQPSVRVPAQVRQGFDQPVQLATGKKVFQHSYRGSSVFCVSSGINRGFAGCFNSFIRACLGVRPPLRLLHRKQQQTMFSQVVCPPCDLGTTWSRLNL